MKINIKLEKSEIQGILENTGNPRILQLLEILEFLGKQEKAGILESLEFRDFQGKLDWKFSDGFRF